MWNCGLWEQGQAATKRVLDLLWWGVQPPGLAVLVGRYPALPPTMLRRAVEGIISSSAEGR